MYSSVVLHYQWIEEVRHFMPEVPFVLVGCKKDLRTHEKVRFPVTTEEVYSLDLLFVDFIDALYRVRPLQQASGHIVMSNAVR